MPRTGETLAGLLQIILHPAKFLQTVWLSRKAPAYKIQVVKKRDGWSSSATQALNHGTLMSCVFHTHELLDLHLKQAVQEAKSPPFIFRYHLGRNLQFNSGSPILLWVWQIGYFFEILQVFTWSGPRVTLNNPWEEPNFSAGWVKKVSVELGVPGQYLIS